MQRLGVADSIRRFDSWWNYKSDRDRTRGSSPFSGDAYGGRNLYVHLNFCFVRLVCLAFVVLFLTGSCREDSVSSAPRTVDEFSRKVQADTSFPMLVDLFGWPDADKGSGVHIYVYMLLDGTQIWIGFSSQILYMMHVDKDGALITKLL